MTKDLFYKIEGSGIPVLLIHGFTGSHKSFEKVSALIVLFWISNGSVIPFRLSAEVTHSGTPSSENFVDIAVP